MNKGRIIGPSILLGNGTYYDFEHPEAAELCIEDIAYGLAFEGRFAGQCRSRHTGRREMYSVAEHCIYGSFMAPPPLKLQFLMHEVGEMPCGDMVGPLKIIVPEYRIVEKLCERVNASKLGVHFTDPAALKKIDLRMLATERRDLLTQWDDGDEWEWLHGEVAYSADELLIIPCTDKNFIAEEFIRLYHAYKAGDYEVF